VNRAAGNSFKRSKGIRFQFLTVKTLVRKAKNFSICRLLNRRLFLHRFPYYWRVKTRLPERYRQPCRVLVRGGMNSALVQFTDGFKVVTSRNYLRKRKP